MTERDMDEIVYRCFDHGEIPFTLYLKYYNLYGIEGKIDFIKNNLFDYEMETTK